MSPRAARVVFALLVVLFGSAIICSAIICSAIIYALLLAPVRAHPPLWLGALCEVGVLVAGGAVAIRAPPASYRPPTSATSIDAPELGIASVYRGAHPPSRIVAPITKASAQRLTNGIITALFIVAYRCVGRALAKAHAANTRGDAGRSTQAGLGRARHCSAPLALLVALVRTACTVEPDEQRPRPRSSRVCAHGP